MSIRHMSAIWDSQLYDGPKLLMMLALADWADADGWCYPRNETLARRIRRDVKTVYRILGQLETEGAIHRADGRICICEPWIVEEVKRRAEAVDAKNTPPQPPAALKSEKPPLKSENGRTANGNGVLNNENGILRSENPVLTSENEILKNETPFFIDPSITPDLEPSPTPPAPIAAAPTAPAGGGADVPTILRWVNFTDHLNAHEQAILTPPTALAWCYFIHLEEAKPTRPKNAVGLARSRWRSTPPAPPPADLLALAQFWLALADNGRRALLDRLGFTARFGTDDDLDDDFPGLPVAAAIAVYRATGGELAPPSLTPVRESTAAAIAEVRAGPSRSVAQTAPPQPTAAFWRDALAELEMQMTRATFTQLLAGATATLTDDQLTVHVRNHYAADWLSGRLHDLITRTVAGVAGRAITVRYEVCP
mgnify:CR=1 FL=1